MAKKGAKSTIKKTRAVKASPKETNLVRRVSVRPRNPKIAEFRPGDSVNVFVKVKEGEKERVQVYKGTVTKIQGSGNGRSFTVRKISAGVGVERSFPFSSPAVESVELLTHGQVRRSKLYYLRDREGKSAKIDSEMAMSSGESTVEVAAKVSAKESEKTAESSEAKN